MLTPEQNVVRIASRSKKNYSEFIIFTAKRKLNTYVRKCSLKHIHGVYNVSVGIVRVVQSARGDLNAFVRVVSDFWHGRFLKFSQLVLRTECCYAICSSHYGRPME